MSAAWNGPLTAVAIRDGLTPRRIGRHVLCLDETGSTNDDAFELARLHACDADGWAVFAERQTRGRGRLGRRWVSPRGAGLHCSIVLCEHDASGREAALALSAGVAAAQAIARVTEVAPNVRWPNDLFVRGRKLGGVLVERRGPVGGVPVATVIGIGVNCLQQAAHFATAPEVSQPATSLEIESAQPIDRRRVAQALLQSLDEWLGSASPPDAAALNAWWRRLSDDLGKRVTIECAGRQTTGRMADLNPDAWLLLEADDGCATAFDPRIATIVARHD